MIPSYIYVLVAVLLATLSIAALAFAWANFAQGIFYLRDDSKKDDDDPSELWKRAD